MCGIAGWLTTSRSLLRGDLDRLLLAISHRGPDDVGTFIDENAGLALGHRRLSIIDLSSAGHQPMVNQENGDVLVFNGEIYNFKELRTELQENDMRFRSQSDSEVLLMAFQKWGVDCTRYIRGMFAFAVWRAKEQTLYLIRDPIGMKPLYYWCPPSGGLVFASEIKAFLQLPGFPARLDDRALGQFLEFGYCFEPERSILEGVSRLTPGHFLCLKAGGRPKLKRYFSPELLPDPSPSGRDLEEELFEALR